MRPFVTKFILIDPSISDTGGHYYEYALHVLKAAEKSGYSPVIGTNRRFRGRPSPSWKVYPIYRFGYWYKLTPPSLISRLRGAKEAQRRFFIRRKTRWMYSEMGFIWLAKNEIGQILGSRPRGAAIPFRFVAYLALGYTFRLLIAFRQLLADVIPFRRYWRRIAAGVKAVFFAILSPLSALLQRDGWLPQLIIDWIRVRQFARDTAKLFKKEGLKEGDIVFFPTVSEIETEGLFRAISRRAEYSKARFHLLFRRDVFAGRESDFYNLNRAQAAVRNTLIQCSKRPAFRRVAFHTDTEELANQYNALGVAEFSSLPIPHIRKSHKNAHRSSRYPLHVIYAGDARTEKGYHYIPQIVRDLWEDYVKTGRVVFNLQSNFNTPLGDPKAIVARNQLEQYPNDKVKILHQPLSSAQYWQFIASGDINLLLYDPNNYYARSSGIFAESLGLGIPCVVPSGTWMSRQLLAETYKYHVLLREEMRLIRAYDHEELDPHFHLRRRARPKVGIDWHAGGGDAWAYCWIRVPESASHVLISFSLAKNTERSSLELHIDQLDSRRYRLRMNKQIVEEAPNRERCSVLAHLQNGAEEIWLGLRNAHSAHAITITQVEVAFLQPDSIGLDIPLGVVGMTYGSPEEITWAVRETIEQYDHYRKTAESFSEDWNKVHNAPGLIKALEDSLI